MSEFDLGTARGQIRLDVNEQDFKKARREVEGVGKAGKTSGQRMQRFGKQAQTTGKTMNRRVTAPIAGLATAVVGTAAKFESSMNRVKAVTSANAEEMEKMEGVAQKLGSTTEFSASQAAEGMGFLAQAGFEVNEVTEAMPGVLNLASAGQMDLARAADISSNVLTGFGEEASEVSRVNDILAETSRSANTNVTQMGDAMAYVAPVANSSGMSIEETSAAIGGLSNAGIQGSKAGTTLRQAIARLESPSDKAASKLDELGIKTHDAQGEMLPMVDIVRQFEEAGFSSAAAMEIFGARAGPGMAALVDQGADSLEEMTGNLQNAGGAAEEMAETRMEGLSGTLKELKSALEGVALAIADTGLLEMVTNLAKKITNFFQSLAETNPTLLKVAVAIAGVVAALGPLLAITGTVIAGIVKLRNVVILAKAAWTALQATMAVATGPIGIIVAAIAALTAAVIYAYKNSQTFRDIVHKVWDQVKTAIKYAWEKVIEPAFEAIWWYIKNVLVPIFQTYWEVTKTVFKAIGDFIVWAWDNLIEPTFEELKWFINNVLIPTIEAFFIGWKRIFGAVGDFVMWVWDNLIKPTFDALKFFIVEVLTPTLLAFKNFFIAVWEDMSALLGFIWEEAIKPILSILWTWIKEILVDAFNHYKAIFMAVWNAVSGALQTAWNEFLSPIFNSIYDFVEDKLITAFNNVKDVAEDVWDTIASVVSTAWNDTIKPVFNSLKDFLENTLVPLWDTFKETAKEAWEGLKGAIGTALRAVGGPISSFLDTVASVADTIGMSNLSNVLSSASSSAAGWGVGMHSGGIVGEEKGAGLNRPRGLRSDETERILRQGEEVLTEEDPRHSRNIGDRDLTNKDEAGGLLSTLKDVGSAALDKVRGLIADTVRPAIDNIRGHLESFAEGRSPMASLPAEGFASVLGGITDWIRGVDEKAADEQDSRRGGPGDQNLGGSGSVLNRLVTAFRQEGPPGRFTSGYRPSSSTYHGRKRAADFAGPTPSPVPTPAMDRIFDFWASFGNLQELIYAGAPWNILGGQRLPINAVPQDLYDLHKNHVHVAMGLGGIAKKPVNALLGESGPEAVTPLDASGGLPVPKLENLMEQVLAEERSQNRLIEASVGGRAAVGGDGESSDDGLRQAVADVIREGGIKIEQHNDAKPGTVERGTQRALRQVAAAWGEDE